MEIANGCIGDCWYWAEKGADTMPTFVAWTGAKQFATIRCGCREPLVVRMSEMADAILSPEWLGTRVSPCC